MSQGSGTVRLTWARVTGTLVIQRLEHGAWAKFHTADGNAGCADDADSTLPDPVAYQVRRLKSSDWQEFPNGGDDYERIYRWKPDKKRIEASTIQVTGPNSYVTLVQVPPILPGNEASFTIPITAPDQCSRTLPVHSCQYGSGKDFRSHSR